MNTKAQIIDLQSQSSTEIQATPAVGMGVTGKVYTDCDALTITRVSKSGKVFWATRDTATLLPGWKPEIIPGGFAGYCTNQYSQEYTYTSNPDGREIRFTFGKDGKWKCKKHYGEVTLGVRRAFRDYNF